MSISSADTKRVDTDSRISIFRPRDGLNGHLEIVFLEGDWTWLVEESFSILLGYLLFGFGVTKLIFGGIVLFSRARTALMILVSPDAPSPWPTFGFTCMF